MTLTAILEVFSCNIEFDIECIAGLGVQSC